MKDEKVRDIHERIYQFVIAVLKYIRKLPKTPENLIIIGQLARSATSMGANDQEADGTHTKRDFISKYTIVRKETKESAYWLRALSDLNPNFAEEGLRLMGEAIEIAKIVSTIIYKTSNK
ncbi:MAG: four helix bundle protein [Candidatus Levybacteria bacterium]|nr:four helix bundle protein [Candidatus Levybacteria bacterium]